MDERRARSFGAAAQAYARSRPSYPLDAVRWLLPDGARRVLDLGAGTGRLTAQLLDLGLEVVAVEPSDEMRALVPATAHVLAGTAEAVPLPDASVDAVLVAQAWHWFDVPQALAEVTRVLRPGGALGLLWNERDETDAWVRDVWALVGADPERHADGLPFAGAGGLSDPVLRQFAHQQELDADLLVDLVASRSAVIVRPEPERARLLAQVRRLAPPGRFVLPYRTDAWRSLRT